jgi:hypothetical protein
MKRQTMTDLVALVDAAKSTGSGRPKKNSPAQERDKALTKAAQEMRDGAMRGNVPRRGLTDITNLEGATTRERTGQRKYALHLFFYTYPFLNFTQAPTSIFKLLPEH